MYRTLGKGQWAGKLVDFQDPTEGIRTRMGPTFSPGLEKQTVFGVLKEVTDERLCPKVLCSGSLGMAMLLFRLAHQFQPLLAALRHPNVSSYTPKRDPRDISDWTSGVRPRIRHSF